MELYLTLLLAILVGLSQANDNGYGDVIESEDKMDKQDQEAFESFGSPVYGPGTPKSGSLPPSPKSGYPLPPTVLPAGYSSYLNSLGYGNLGYGYGTAPYGRYGVLPYSSSPYYGYGSPYNAMALGYGPGVSAGLLGYSSALAYGSPAYGRGAYSIYGNGYPGYAGLGYRYGGLGYNSALLRAPAVPSPAAYTGVPAGYPGVTAAFANGAVPVPVPGPLTARPGPVPLPAAPYRPPVVTQGKDGSLRYAYAPPVAQRLAGY